MDYNIYWGDIHNHNEMGYAKGSMERSIDIAKSNLDFYAFTGQSQWHDMKEYESDAHMHWINGFEKHTRGFDKIKRLIKQANKPNEFTAFLGYEWHSSKYGDYCIIFSDDGELAFCDNINKLRQQADKYDGVLIPHHLGYKTGRRGFNINALDTDYSPVVEIFSEHGLCERDTGRFDMLTHSMGGRVTGNCLQNILKKGYKVGVVASSDTHLGYPGAYGEGLTAIYAENLTRRSVMEAIKNRRTYMVTGEKIYLDFKINGQLPGSVIHNTNKANIDVFVNAWDEIFVVEVVKNNEVIHRYFPKEKGFDKKIKTRLDFGWGPWNDLNIKRICDWDISLNISGDAKITDFCSCFNAGPFDELRRNKVIRQSDKQLKIISYTSREAKRPINSVVFEIEGNEYSKIDVTVTKPTKVKLQRNISQLLQSSDICFTGDFPKESLKLNKAVTEDKYTASFSMGDKISPDKEDYYYVRVVQNNGHMAISSPIWIKR